MTTVTALPLAIRYPYLLAPAGMRERDQEGMYRIILRKDGGNATPRSEKRKDPAANRIFSKARYNVLIGQNKLKQRYAHLNKTKPLCQDVFSVRVDRSIQGYISLGWYAQGILYTFLA